MNEEPARLLNNSLTSVSDAYQLLVNVEHQCNNKPLNSASVLNTTMCQDVLKLIIMLLSSSIFIRTSLKWGKYIKTFEKNKKIFFAKHPSIFC